MTKIPSKIAKLGVTVTDQDGVKVRYEHNDAGELVKAIRSFAFGIEIRLQKLTVDEVGMEF